MTLDQFNSLKLNIGDNIWIQNEKGESFGGLYKGNLNSKILTFDFLNFSNGHIESIKWPTLQRLDINKRV